MLDTAVSGEPEDQPLNASSRAALAKSCLAQQRAMSNAADAALVEMIRTNSDLGIEFFTTPGDRPCVILMGVGEDAVEAVKGMWAEAQARKVN